MDPGQRDVRRHRAERDRVVPDTGKVLVGGPIVGDQRVWGATAPSTPAMGSVAPELPFSTVHVPLGDPPTLS